MWTSTTCDRGPRSRCRAWRSSIASEAARAQVLGENGAAVRSGSKSRAGCARRANFEFELAAPRHAFQALDVNAEVRSLAPRNDLPIRVVAEPRRLHEGQRQRTVVEDQCDGSRGMNIAGLLVDPGGNVHPQPVAQGAAAIPFDRAQIGEAHVLAGDQYRILRPRREF